MRLERTEIDQMAAVIERSLNDYKDMAVDSLKKAVKRAGKTVKEEISAHAPRKSGRYKDSWRTKVTHEDGTSIQLVVHSPKRYMLAHLLERSHVLRNGGRTKARPHIKPAEEKGIKKVEDEITAALQKG